MGRKGAKIPNETKLNYARLCFERKISKSEASRQLGVDCATVRGWVYRYREQGELAFLDPGRNNVYSAELKSQAVRSYLNGEGSQREIAAKYGLDEALVRSTYFKCIGTNSNQSTAIFKATFDHSFCGRQKTYRNLPRRRGNGRICRQTGWVQDLQGRDSVAEQ